MNDCVMEVRGVTKRYEGASVDVLQDVTFSVPRGSFFALLGLNGAGKSSLIHILSGLSRYEGDIRMFGLDHRTSLKECQKRLGLLPQDINLNPFMKVMDVLQDHVGYYGLSWSRMREWGEYVLERLSLVEHRHKRIFQLSGGMKRRVMFARAVVTRPELVLLDEPTAGVDIHLRHAIYEFLDEMKRMGTSVILTTHYLEEADKLCSDYALLVRGRVKHAGLIEDIRGQTPISVRLTFRSLPEEIRLPQGVRRLGGQDLAVDALVPEVFTIFDFLNGQGLELMQMETTSQLASMFEDYVRNP